MQKLFQRVIVEKKFKSNRVEVIDYQEVLSNRYKMYDLEPRVAERHSWFFIYVVGRLLTVWKTWCLRRENEARKKQKAAKNEPKVRADKAEDAAADDAENN